jgi:hypothetical protein
MTDDIVTITEDEIIIEAGADTPTTKRTLHPCLCGLVRVDFNGEEMTIEDLPRKYRAWAEYNPDTHWIHVETGCEALTYKVFAPGHDARFKGLLQTAHRQGGEVWFDGVSTSPADFATERTPGLVSAITNPVAPRPAAKPKATEPKPRRVRAKVGRWEYVGEIALVGTGKDKTEHFLYDSNGTNKVASNFTILEEIA